MIPTAMRPVAVAANCRVLLTDGSVKNEIFFRGGGGEKY